LKSIREDPGICPVCSMVNPALHSYAIRNALNVEPFLRTESLQLRWSGHVSTVEQGCTTASVWLAALRPPVSFRCFYLICIASVLLPHVCLGRLSTNCPHTAGKDVSYCFCITTNTFGALLQNSGKLIGCRSHDKSVAKHLKPWSDVCMPLCAPILFIFYSLLVSCLPSGATRGGRGTSDPGLSTLGARNWGWNVTY